MSPGPRPTHLWWIAYLSRTAGEAPAVALHTCSCRAAARRPSASTSVCSTYHTAHGFEWQISKIGRHRQAPTPHDAWRGRTRSARTLHGCSRDYVARPPMHRHQAMHNLEWCAAAGRSRVLSAPRKGAVATAELRFQRESEARRHARPPPSPTPWTPACQTAAAPPPAASATARGHRPPPPPPATAPTLTHHGATHAAYFPTKNH